MVKLWKLFTLFAAAATTAYVLSTCSVSKVPNGYQVNSPRSSTVITHNSGTTTVHNKPNNTKQGMEKILEINGNEVFGSLIYPQKSSLSGKYNYIDKKGSLEKWINNSFIGTANFDYDNTKPTTFQKWFSGFDYLKNYNGKIGGYSYNRL